MRLLLDTHLLLWWMSNDPALSKQARELIADPNNTIFISAITMWEIWLKKSLGKLELPGNFEEALAKESFESLPLSSAAAKGVAELPWLHRDPFDRVLIAQARESKLWLITADKEVAAYGHGVQLT